MLRFVRPLLIATLLAVAPAASATLLDQPTTQPVDLATLELRANQLFAQEKYAEALPLLKQVAVRLKDDPDRVAPILEKVRVAEANLPKAPEAAPGTLNATRKPHAPVPAGQSRTLTIKDLGNFDYDPDLGGSVPEDVKQLHGATIQLRGYMIPLDQARRITRFALVPDLFACCFGQPPGLQHTIVVKCPAGSAVSYFPDEIVVTGTLSVGEKVEDGFVVSLFEMTASSVKPVEK